MIIILIIYFLFPVLVLYLASIYPWVKKIGPVVLCYGAGLILGNSGILPAKIYHYQEWITNITIPMAIPLLLFSLNIRSVFKMAGKTFLSLILGLASTIIMVLTGYFLLSDKIPESWKMAGMLTGVYTGGTPNLAAIKIALNVNPDIYILAHSYDVVIGAIMLLFLVSVAQRFFLLFMKPFQPDGKEFNSLSEESFTMEFESYKGIFHWKSFRKLLTGCILSLSILGVSYGLAVLLTSVFKPHNAEIFEMTTVILLITTLGIAASLFTWINRIEKSFQAGMYFILVFCVVVASMADIRSFSFESWPILVYIIIAVPGSFLLHSLLSRIFNIDVDNFLIVSTSLSMSPPFVPVVAGALKNKDIIIPGLVVGIIGYAIGNYLGILVAFILK